MKQRRDKIVSTLFQCNTPTLFQRCATLKNRRLILFHFQRQISVISILIHYVGTTLTQRWNVDREKGQSKEHAIVKLANQINESFERSQYALEVPIDLSKAFDTVNCSLLIKKLQMYGIRGINLAWFPSYLANRKSIFR